MVDNTLIPILEQYTDKTNQKIAQEDINYINCSICHVNFFNSNEFEQHKREKHGKKKYECFQCESSFHRQDHLKRHVNSVHSTKLTLCPVCDQEFSNRDILYQHLKNCHSDETSFHCRECFLKCRTIDELREHENGHLLTNNKHLCSYCSKPFKRRDHMLRHVKTAHLNHSVKCPKCNQIFKRNDHVARHCREKHNLHCYSEQNVIKIIDSNDSLSDDAITEKHIELIPNN